MVLSDAGCPTPSRKDEQLQRDTVSNRERSDDISEFPYVQGFNNNQGSGNRLGSAGLFKALAHLDPRESRKRGRAGSY